MFEMTVACKKRVLFIRPIIIEVLQIIVQILLFYRRNNRIH